MAVLMVVHSYYDEDPRVRREAEALVAAGRPVIVIALRRPLDPAHGALAGVEIRRIDVQRHQGAGLPTYLLEYVTFGLRAGWLAWRTNRQRPLGLVQVHSLPDFLAFAALPLRVSGVPLLLDLHEAMPELFRSRFPRAANPVVQWALRLQERLSIGISTLTLSVNDAMRDRLLRLGVPGDHVVVVPNAPSLGRFDVAAYPPRRFGADDVVRLVYAGALTPIYEVDVAIRAMAILAHERPGLRLRLDIYGRGDTEDELKRLALAHGIGGAVTFHGRIPIDDMPAALADADIGLAPTRRDPFTDLSLSTKVWEYAAMRKPVVASRLPLVERTFPAGSVTTYEPGDPVSMAHAIATVIDDAAAREASVELGMLAAREAAWEAESERYVGLVDRLAIVGRPRRRRLAFGRRHPSRPAPPTRDQATPSER
jgi:glycosyltransferase involved in cell wall biosynthesis